MNRQHVVFGLILAGVTFILWTGRQTLLAAPAAVSFYDSGQSLAGDSTVGAAAADLNGDGFPDVVTVSSGSAGPARIWLNGGSGFFSTNSQSLNTPQATDVALADLNGDTFIDAFVTVGGTSPGNQIWWNNGSGQFTDSGQRLGSQVSHGAALGDLNGDSRTDAFVANQGANAVFVQGSGAVFTKTGQTLGTATSYAVALDDLDGDNDLDAFVANGGSGGAPNTVWINNGSGSFTDSGQALGFSWSYDVALGDLDGNSTIDAVTANWVNGGGHVYLNDGSAVYTDTGQTLGTVSALGVDLADVDSDGDLDVILAAYLPDPSEVWLNQGDGTFVAGPTLSPGTAAYAVVADRFDGDGDVDLFLGIFGPDELWFNGIPGLPNAVFPAEREDDSSGRPSTFWDGTGSASLTIALDAPAAAAVEVKTRIDVSGTVTTKTTTFNPGQQSGTVTISNPGVGNAADLSLWVGFSGTAPDDLILTDAVRLVFVDSGQSTAGCIICYAEWLLRFLGFNPSFGALHHIDYGDRVNSDQWAYYAGLFGDHSSEMSGIVLTHPMILVDGYNALESWTPALQTFDGSGDGVVTQGMINDAQQVLDRLEANASPELAALIQHETTTLDLDSWAGLTVSEMWDDVVEKKQPTTIYLPTIRR